MIANRKIEQSLYRLIKWSEKPQWVEFLNHTYFNHLDYALDDLDLTEVELFDYLEPEARDAMNSAIFEDFFTKFYDANDELNVINDYLKRRGSRESPVVRQFLKALLDSSVSMYEVVELEPKGRTMKVRDLLQEDMTLTVQTSSDLDNWVIWDCVGARVISMNGKHYFTNGALLLSRSLSKEIVESVHRIARDIERDITKRARMMRNNSTEIPSISRELLCAAVPIAPMLTHAWLEENVSFAETPLPTIHNSDNEEVMVCDVQFPILGDQTELIAKLDEFEEFVRLEEETTWSWLESGSPAYRIAQHQNRSPESKLKSGSNENENEIGSTALGCVKMGLKSLVLSVNSAERADRGRILLESRLGNLVGQSLTSYQDLEQAMNELTYSKDKNSPIMNEDVSALQASHLEEHYSLVLDNPVLMLGNKIPRKAAATKQGRSEVVEWLKTLENMEHRRAKIDGVEPFDMIWMWEELKIDALRK